MYFKNNFAENPTSDQKIDAFLSDEYKNYHDVFNWKKADELPLYCQYDHWIELINKGIPL